MRYRLLDAILLVIALAGSVMAWRTAQEQARLRAKIERMTRAAGDLIVTDPTRIHVQALDTGEPLHYAWRVYLPADYDLVERGTPAGAASVSPTGSTASRELILRVRFRESAEGELKLYEAFEGGNSRRSFGDKALAEVLRGRFEKVLVDQLGTHGPVSVGVDEPLDLLSLRLPADMEAECLKQMSPARRARFDPQFFRFSFGPEPRKPSPSGGGEPIP